MSETDFCMKQGGHSYHPKKTVVSSGGDNDIVELYCPRCGDVKVFHESMVFYRSLLSMIEHDARWDSQFEVFRFSFTPQALRFAVPLPLYDKLMTQAQTTK